MTHLFTLMSQIYFSTYEGDIIGYKLEIDDL